MGVCWRTARGQRGDREGTGRRGRASRGLPAASWCSEPIFRALVHIQGHPHAAVYLGWAINLNRKRLFPRDAWQQSAGWTGCTDERATWACFPLRTPRPSLTQLPLPPEACLADRPPALALVNSALAWRGATQSWAPAPPLTPFSSLLTQVRFQGLGVGAGNKAEGLLNLALPPRDSQAALPGQVLWSLGRASVSKHPLPKGTIRASKEAFAFPAHLRARSILLPGMLWVFGVASLSQLPRQASSKIASAHAFISS